MKYGLHCHQSHKKFSRKFLSAILDGHYIFYTNGLWAQNSPSTREIFKPEIFVRWEETT